MIKLLQSVALERPRLTPYIATGSSTPKTCKASVSRKKMHTQQEEKKKVNS